MKSLITVVLGVILTGGASGCIYAGHTRVVERDRYCDDPYRHREVIVERRPRVVVVEPGRRWHDDRRDWR